MTSAPGYLLDTNIASETRRKRANRGVLDFLTACDPESLFLSVLTIGELRKGASARMRTDQDAAAALGTWIDGIETVFASRILRVDTAVATCWGKLSAARTLPVIDTLLAATAITHGLVLVTRNGIDVASTGVILLNPFTAPGPAANS